MPPAVPIGVGEEGDRDADVWPVGTRFGFAKHCPFMCITAALWAVTDQPPAINGLIFCPCNTNCG